MNKLTLLISIFIFLISSPFAQAVSLSANKTQVVPGETITISFNSSQAHWGDWIGMVPFNASAGTISYSGASYQDWRYLHGTKDLSSNPTTQGAVVFTVPDDLPLIGSDGITAMDFVYYQYGSIEAARIRVALPAPTVLFETSQSPDFKNIIARFENISDHTGDWIAMVLKGAAYDGLNWDDWRYLNNSKIQPSSVVAKGEVAFPLPPGFFYDIKNSGPIVSKDRGEMDVVFYKYGTIEDRRATVPFVMSGDPVASCAAPSFTIPKPPLPQLVASFNVRDYGVTGSGSSEDRAAVARALADAQAAGGGNIYFPAGTYSVPLNSHLIELNGFSNIMISGDGPSTIFQLQRPNCGTCITSMARFFGQNSNIAFTSFTIQGTTDRYLNPVPIELGIWLETQQDSDRLDGLIVRGVTFRNMGNVGVQINNYFKPDGTGPAVKNIFVTNNVFRTVRGSIGLCTASDALFADNVFLGESEVPNDDDLILCRNISRVIVERNFHDKGGPSRFNRGRAIVVEQADHGSTVKDVVIRDNTIQNHLISDANGIFPSIHMSLNWEGAIPAEVSGVIIARNTITKTNRAIGLYGIGQNSAVGAGICVEGNTISGLQPVDSVAGKAIVIDSIASPILQSNFIQRDPIQTSDDTAPDVSITQPANADTVSGSNVTVSADAWDNVGVAGVQFKLDGNNFGEEDTSSPYVVSWDTTQSLNGSHSITAVARDAAGHTVSSEVISVTVINSIVATPSLSTDKTQVIPGETISISFNSSQAHWGDWIGMVPFNASAGTISYSGASYQDWRYLHGTKDLSSNPTTQGAVVFTVPADLPLIGSDGITAMDFVYYQYGSIEAARIRVSSGKTFTDPAPGVTAPTISCQIKRDEGGEIRHAAAQSTLVIPPTALPATAQSGEPITITMEVIELTDLTPQTSIASAAQAIGLKLGGSALRLGPAGLAFAKPVTLKMALSSSCAPTTKAGIYWWNPNLKVWQRVTDSTLNLASCEVSAPLNHFSIYALFLDPPEPSSLELGEVYVFPNPARKEQKPTFHIETQATLSSLDIRIYDATGQLLHQKTLTGNSPQVTNRAGKVALAYEYTWDSTDIASGVYFYTLKASRQGETVNHKGKFVVVR